MNTTTADARFDAIDDQPQAHQHQAHQHRAHQHRAHRLSRSGDDRMLAGVAGGIARQLDVNVTLVRVAIAALALFTGFGAALYLAAWLLIPADGQDESLAQAWIAERRDRSR